MGMPVEARRGIPWTLLTYATTRVMTVLTTLALARLLAPADFGLFAMATLAMELLSVFSGLWLGAALILRTDLDRRGEGTVLTLLMAAGALLALILVVLAPAAAAFFGEPRLAGIAAVLSTVLLVSGVNWFYETLLQRELAFGRRFASQVVRTLAFSAVALGLALAGAGVWSLALAYLAGYLASAGALLVLTPYRVRPAFDRGEARRVVRSGRGFLAQDLATFLGQNADFLAVGRLLGPSQLGYYAMAFRQAELPNYAIADPVGKVTFPAFAQMRQRGEDVGPSFLRTLRYMALATVPAGVVLSAAAVPFSVALFGADWKPMAAPLAILGVWAVMRPLQVTIGTLLNSLGRAEVYGRVSMVSLVPLVGGTFLAASLGGVTAVAWVLLAHMTATFGVLAMAAERHGGIHVRDQGKALWPLAAAATASWAVTHAIVALLASAPPALALAAAVAGCLASYIGALTLLAPGLLRSALRDARLVLGRRPGAERTRRRLPWRSLATPSLAIAVAASVGALSAVEPKLAVGLVVGGLLLALPFVVPVAHLLLLILVTAVVPFDVQNGLAFGGGAGSPGLFPSDILLLGGLARAGLVLLDTPLDRRPRWALSLVGIFLLLACLQLVHGLSVGNDAGTSGAELRVLLGLGSAVIALPILADAAQRTRLFKGLVGVGLAVGLWGLVQWTVDIPFTSSEDAGVREGVRFTSAGRGQIQGGLFAFPVAIVMATAALLSSEVRSAGARGLLIAVVALNSVDLVLTYERTFWVATLIGLAVLALKASREQRVRALVTGSALIALALAGMAILAPRDLTAARERLLSLGSYGEDLSVRYRLTESRHVLEEVGARPLTGSGLGATILWGRAYEQVPPETETFAHNGYLWLAWKLGAPAAALLLLICAAALLSRGPPGPATTFELMRCGAQAALVLLLVGSITFPAFEALGITAVMGLLLALCFSGRQVVSFGGRSP
jgi:O-antigen/teichoic acid export membrane protein